MADRRFVKPASFTIQPRKINPLMPADAPTFEQDFDSAFCTIIWSSPKWNGDGWDDAMIRCSEAIEAAPPGGNVDLSLEDWEKLRDAVKERAEAGEFKGPYAPQLRKMARAIKSACKPPEGA
jgi:hypothetical protein